MKSTLSRTMKSTLAGSRDFSAIKLHPKDIAGFFHKDLRRIVNIHAAMFRKLLFEDEKLPLELADLFEDVGNRYLDFSERISQLHQSREKKED